jgi:hypothetical protein
MMNFVYDKRVTFCDGVVYNRDELLVMREDQPSVEEITIAVVKECRRENVLYKMEALRCISSIVQTYDIDKFADISEILLPFLSAVRF